MGLNRQMPETEGEADAAPLQIETINTTINKKKMSKQNQNTFQRQTPNQYLEDLFPYLSNLSVSDHPNNFNIKINDIC